MCDKHQATEEPCELKSSCTVLKSNGSREGVVDFTRSCADAIEQAFNRIASKNGGSRGDTWVLDADISGFFDHVSHRHIENALKATPGRELIKMWLKSGFLDKGTFYATDQGTPQGGVISPLLANIGLHGLEKAIRDIPYRSPSGRINYYGMGIIRYARGRFYCHSQL